MSTTNIRTVGTLYLGGQQHGFKPGSIVPVPAEHAAALIAVGHAAPIEQAPPATVQAAS